MKNETPQRTLQPRGLVLELAHQRRVAHRGAHHAGRRRGVHRVVVVAVVRAPVPLPLHRHAHGQQRQGEEQAAASCCPPPLHGDAAIACSDSRLGSHHTRTTSPLTDQPTDGRTDRSLACIWVLGGTGSLVFMVGGACMDAGPHGPIDVARPAIEHSVVGCCCCLLSEPNTPKPAGPSSQQHDATKARHDRPAGRANNAAPRQAAAGGRPARAGGPQIIASAGWICLLAWPPPPLWKLRSSGAPAPFALRLHTARSPSTCVLCLEMTGGGVRGGGLGGMRKGGGRSINEGKQAGTVESSEFPPKLG